MRAGPTYIPTYLHTYIPTYLRQALGRYSLIRCFAFPTASVAKQHHHCKLKGHLEQNINVFVMKVGHSVKTDEFLS